MSGYKDAEQAIEELQTLAVTRTKDEWTEIATTLWARGDTGEEIINTFNALAEMSKWWKEAVDHETLSLHR